MGFSDLKSAEKDRVLREGLTFLLHVCLGFWRLDRVLQAIHLALKASVCKSWKYRLPGRVRHFVEVGRSSARPRRLIHPSWLQHGRVSGIEMPIDDLGIFPKSNQYDDVESDMAWRATVEHENYSSVDGDPEAECDVQRLIDTGFIKTFDSLEACKKYLGAARLRLSRPGWP